MVDVSDLDKSSASLKRAIKGFRTEIGGLEARIRSYENMAVRGGEGYEIAALAASNEHAREQIERMEQGISTMQLQIADNNRMKEFLETKAKLAEGIVLDADADD